MSPTTFANYLKIRQTVLMFQILLLSPKNIFLCFLYWMKSVMRQKTQ